MSLTVASITGMGSFRPPGAQLPPHLAPPPPTAQDPSGGHYNSAALTNTDMWLSRQGNQQAASLLRQLQQGPQVALRCNLNKRLWRV